MGLLAPLYALAALAIVGPIIFHLIKRQPQGQQRFSSLMFLTPSPPRLTRRSRLDNLFLLLLRALAIALIAIAFTRPFFREESFLNRSLDGRNIALLVDVSASMQRPDVWQAAKRQANSVIDSLSPSDRVSLFTIDNTLGTVVPLENENANDAASQQQAVRAALVELKPSWRGSELAEGLKALADLIQAAALSGKIDSAERSEIVLVSDLHLNCGVESLQGYPWPESIRLDVRQVQSATPGNARATLLSTDEEVASEEAATLKVRVENNGDSKLQSFDLNWTAGNGETVAKTTVQVPPGQIRVVPVPAQPPRAHRLELKGDSWDGDNAIFVADIVGTRERILFAGQKVERVEDDLGYFLEKAPLSTESVKRVIERVEPSQLENLINQSAQANTTGPQAETLRAVVIEPPVDAQQARTLRRFAEQGGNVIVCLARPATAVDPSLEALRALFDQPEMQIVEAATKDYALLSAIDYQHPVFRPFADPRFNDFSKIRIWAHRQVQLPESTTPEKSLQRVASLDDGSPWLLQSRLGQGNLWIFTSGWQPVASQFGLSSKFVPILLGVLDPSGKTLAKQKSYAVGEAILVDDLPNLRVTQADGAVVPVEPSGNAIRLETPGLYNLESDQSRRQVAIQVAANESQLTPQDPDVFEQYGIALERTQSDAQRKQTARQMQAAELERKQRVWQWLLVAGLVVLALESWLAGWFARRTSTAASNTNYAQDSLPQTAG